LKDDHHFGQIRVDSCCNKMVSVIHKNILEFKCRKIEKSQK
jgi:hypothetical protein